MCGECCRRYMIPVNLSDILYVSEFTGLDPTQFLELVTPDESVIHTYYDIPKIESQDKGNKVLCLKEVNGKCVFLNDGRCAIYQARPLRCRFFPFTHQRRKGEIAFSVKDEATGFCKGLSGEAKGSALSELTCTVLEMEKKQDTFRKIVEDWNNKVAGQQGISFTLSDFLKFLLRHTRYV